MPSFLSLVSSSPEFKLVCESIEKKQTPVTIVGTGIAQKSQLISSIAEKTGKKVFVITADETDAKKIREDLTYFLDDEVKLYKTKEYVFFDADISTKQSELDRISVINSLYEGKSVCASMSAVMQYTIKRELFEKLLIKVGVGDTLDMDEFIEKLNFCGYKYSSEVSGEGQFAHRGSIVDVYYNAGKNPVRIEFFGDEIDSIREFDVVYQTSIANIDEVSIYPVRELIYDRTEIDTVSKKIRALKNENLMSDIEKFNEEHYFPSADKYLPFFYSEIPTILDYLDDYIIFIDEPNVTYDRAKTYFEEQNEIITDMLDKGLFPKTKGEYLKSPDEVFEIVSKKLLVGLSGISHMTPGYNAKHIVNISVKTMQSYSGQLSFLYDDLEYWKKHGYKTIVLLSSEAKADNLKHELDERGIESVVKYDLDDIPGSCGIYIGVGNISGGFEYPTLKSVVVSDGSVFGAPKKKKKYKGATDKQKIRSFDELKTGDYVVHHAHGIGQYVGIDSLVVEKIRKDYLKIKYKSGDFLYVPTSQLNLIHKYIGSEAKNVKLNKLGGTDWHKTTRRVKESVELLAKYLIELYAQRSKIKGHAFSPDTPWQKEFEDSFPYDETPDQLKCIEDVKADMHAGKCMDRLLCGDVGYGKTEVAMRAAFKCVMEGMQVAYLVPTTILAQQHYNTFKARMDAFAVDIEMLSRFRTKKEQAKIAERLKSGGVDIVIGTHRLLQKDIQFKNLGLLIIDEEQRFGVAHKEALKAIKKDVSVLTLSATPIPRTLNMAMSGIRDLSVIAQPPQNRYPVQTFVLENNDMVVQNAVSREINRGGQVYYLYNRVEGIERKAAEIKKLVPDANVSIAHGQMSEAQLERIMVDLLNGEIDVLVCTTIIETGLDIPNVNTIIIEKSDRLGLSQLYQLRGRVGRSNRLSYAYLMYDKDKVLDKTSQKRLQAIKEFTEFGSGFKIAMRDLEIRGAGNLLGKEQHGNMNLVGYDMYCTLLEEAVKLEKGIKVKSKPDITIDLSVDAYIPKSYIDDESIRIEIYKKISDIIDIDDYNDTLDEIIDRFGDVPECVVNLLDISYIKSMAEKANMTDISQDGDAVIFTVDENVSLRAIVDISEAYKGKIMFTSGEKSYLSYKYTENMLSNIKIILQKFINSTNE